MRKLSLWAKLHPIAARLLIVLCYLPLNVSGLVTGDLLFDFGLRFSPTFFWIVILIFLVTVFNYPSKGMHRVPYGRRKAADMILVTCTFLMICCTSNHLNYKISSGAISIAMTGNASPGIASAAPVNLPVLKPKPGKTGKQLRKKLRHYLKEFRKHYKSRTDEEKAILIVLSVLAAAGLILLLSALSCSIACGGAEGLAYVVFFAGLFGIVFLLVKVIQRIKRGPKQPEPPEDKVSPRQGVGSI